MEINDIIVPSATAGIGSLLTWIFGRKRENVEVSGNELENTKKAIEIWQNTAERLEQKVNELMTEVDKLRIEVQELREENHNLKKGRVK